MLKNDIFLFISLVLCVKVPENYGIDYPYDAFQQPTWDHFNSPPAEFLPGIPHLPYRPYHPHPHHNIRNIFETHGPQNPFVDDDYFEYNRPSRPPSPISHRYCTLSKGKPGVCKKRSECENLHHSHAFEGFSTLNRNTLRCTIYNRWGHGRPGICCPKERSHYEHPKDKPQYHHLEKLPHENPHESWEHKSSEHEKHFHNPSHEIHHDNPLREHHFKKPFTISTTKSHEIHQENPLREQNFKKPFTSTATSHEIHHENPLREHHFKKPLTISTTTSHAIHHENPLREHHFKKPFTTSTTKRPKLEFKCKVVPFKFDSKPKKEYEISPDLVTTKSIDISLSAANKSLTENEFQNKLLMRKNLMVRKGTAAAGHLRFTATSEKIVARGKLGDIFYEVSHDLSSRFNLNKGQKISGLKMYNVSNVKTINMKCPPKPDCNKQSHKYRTSDGSCNNLFKPKWGQSLTPLTRLVSPAYSDGEWMPRIAADCHTLPSARLLSQTFIKDVDKPSKKYSLFLMQFGQFLDHDFTSVPIYRFHNQSGIQCCSSDGQILPKKDQHKSCYPIEIPDKDPFYSPHGRKCMNFVRSRVAPRIDCSLGYADQMNALTHWIDASNVYGSDSDDSNELRLGKFGLLKFSNVAGHRMLLPLRDTDGDGCTDAVAGKFCFRAGDFRVNEMVGLAISHLIWFREHNRIAIELHKMNEHWDDEELYQEARRILIAEYQHIIYHEWVPIIIGEEYMKKNDIFPLEEGYFEGYNSNTDPSVANEFSSAAFRMGHSLVQGIVQLFNRLGEKNGESVISENSNNPHGIRATGRIDDWIRGLTRFPIQTYDNHITAQLNGRLFQPKGMKFGLDLSSLNIQRARDHGVQGYNSYREYCGRDRAVDFDDFQDVIPTNIIELLKIHYSHVDDVDLWIGGLSEKPEPGKLIGPTFACIIGDQFVRSKKGDRYFYDIGNEDHSFTEEQLSKIRRVSFARILCDNGDSIKEMQPFAFLTPDDEENPLIDCRDDVIHSLDLSLWKSDHDHR